MALLKFHTKRTDTRTHEERQESLGLGRLGEQMATKYLEDNGYVILERNYHKGHLEIDIIALDGKDLVVIEVKSRGYDAIMRPEDAVGHEKRMNMIRLANQFVKSHGRKENVRFDIVAIVKNEHGVELKHIKNAFNVMQF